MEKVERNEYTGGGRRNHMIALYVCVLMQDDIMRGLTLLLPLTVVRTYNSV